MILRILVGAILGAVIGYVVGWVVEMFPNFNSALLGGLQAITGIGGIKTSALLAAIGFILGIIGGLAHGLTSHRHRYRY